MTKAGEKLIAAAKEILAGDFVIGNEQSEIVEEPPLRWNDETGRLECSVQVYVRGRPVGRKWVVVPNYRPNPKDKSDDS